MIKGSLKLVLYGLCAGALLVLGRVSTAQTAVAVPQLDLDHVRGTWYEIARYPTKSEKDCGRNAFELIAFGSGKNTLEFVNSCTSKQGDADVSSMIATQDKSKDGKLKVRHLLIFSKHYWVLALAPDDAWMLIGSPNHKQLWVLSKTPTLSADVLAQIQLKAASEGFESSKLVLTPQNPSPAA